MKKVLACLLAVCLLVTFVGCAKEAGGKQNDDDAKTKMGMAVIATAEASEEEAALTAIAAVVLTDADGKIISCRLDEVQLQPKMENGALKDVTDFKTKYELGEDYGMKVAGAKQEWYAQVDAFCKYVVGKTANEVSGIETKDGKGTDADLTAGCTIIVTDFIKAVAKAAVDVTQTGANATDKLGLAVTASRYADSEDTAPRYDIEFTGVAVGGDGKVTACRADELQKNFTVTDGKFVAESGPVKTKRQLGDDYNMKAASSIGLEWYVQVDNLQKYLAGKSDADIGAIQLTDGKITDADLTSGCTIMVPTMLANVQKAIKAAK